MYSALISILVTISFFYLAFKIIRSMYLFRRLIREGLLVKGIIKELKTTKNDDNETYQPIIQFKTYSSLEVTGSPMFHYNKDEYVDTPKEVDVIYLEANPKIFITNGQKFNYKALWTIGVVLIMNIFVVKNSLENNPNWLEEFKHLFDKF